MEFHHEDGGSSVEMALVLPILVVLLFAVIQFGLAFYEWQGLQAAAREGARVASYSGAPPWSDVVTRVTDAAAVVKGGTISVELDVGGSWTVPAGGDVACDGTNDEVRLRVSYASAYPIEVIFFTQDVDMQAEAVFRCENAP